MVAFTGGKENRQIPLFVFRKLPTTLGMEDTDDDDGDREDQSGDGDAEDQVQQVPLGVHVSQGQTGVGAAVVAGDARIVDSKVAEPGGTVHLRE